jgi:hypothetical protein
MTPDDAIAQQLDFIGFLPKPRSKMVRAMLDLSDGTKVKVRISRTWAAIKSGDEQSTADAA